MKVTTRSISEETEITKFPALGLSKLGRIVLFSSKNCGILLSNADISVPSSETVGHYSESWHMGEFKLYIGEVKICNDDN